MGKLDKQKKIAESNRHLFLQIRTAQWMKWRANSQKAYEFFLGDQISEQELEELESAGMPDFTVNKITKSIEVLTYFLTTKNPEWTAVGREDSDVDTAAVTSAMLKYGWDVSRGKSVLGQILQNAFAKSIGYIFIDINPDLDRGMGEVVFDSLEPWDVYPDPASKDIMFSDAAYILIKKDFTKQDLMNKLPQFKTKIINANGNDEHMLSYSKIDVDSSMSNIASDVCAVAMDGSEAIWIDYYEKYIKERVEYMNVTIADTPTEETLNDAKEAVAQEVELFKQDLSKQLESFVITMKDSIAAEEVSEERAEFDIKQQMENAQQQAVEFEQKKMADVVNQLTKKEVRVMTKKEFMILQKNKEFKDRIVDNIPYFDTQIRKVVTLGSDTFLYEQVYKLSDYPIIPVPYLHTATPYPIGSVQMVVGKQRMINKANQIMIHNASLGSSLRWLIERGSVIESEWETNSSRPGGFLYVEPGHNAPTPVQPMQLATAFFTLIQNGGKELEEEMGALASMQGVTAEQPETYRGALAADEFGTRRIKSWAGNVLEPAMEQAGKIWTEMGQQVYTANKVFRIVNPETGETEQHEINIPIYDDFGNVINRYYDYTAKQYDIKFVAGSTLPVNRWAELQEYKDLYKLNVIDDIAVLSKTDVKNKEQIVQRKSLYAQLSQANEALENEVKDMKGTVQTLERQLVQAGIKSQVKDADADLRKITNDHKTSLEKTRIEQKEMVNDAVSDAETKDKEVT